MQKIDIAILGGGIAGLWLLNLLVSRGYSVVLLEKEALGAGQTIASQGMIHGGVKYALQGLLTDAPEDRYLLAGIARVILRFPCRLEGRICLGTSLLRCGRT